MNLPRPQNPILTLEAAILHPKPPIPRRLVQAQQTLGAKPDPKLKLHYFKRGTLTVNTRGNEATET